MVNNNWTTPAKSTEVYWSVVSSNNWNSKKGKKWGKWPLRREPLTVPTPCCTKPLSRSHCQLRYLGLVMSKTNLLELRIDSSYYKFRYLDISLSHREFHGFFNGLHCQFVFIGQNNLHEKSQTTVFLLIDHFKIEWWIIFWRL